MQTTVYDFYNYLTYIEKMRLKDVILGVYLLEMSYLDTSIYQFRYSLVASAVVYLLRKVNKKHYQTLWTQKFQQVTGYALKDVKPCAAFVLNLWEQAHTSPHQASRIKYKKVMLSKLGSQ